MRCDLLCADIGDVVKCLEAESVAFVHADPPWEYRHFSASMHGAAAAYYDGLPCEAIAAHINAAYSVAANDCYLALWCTFPKLEEWFSVAGAVKGWNYISGACWGKTNGLGAGFHFRGDAELLLLYKKGTPQPHDGSKTNLWLADRIGHSEKPQAALRALVSMAAPKGGLVLDLYAGASGSMAHACRALDRAYVGAEIDPARHELAMLRLSQQEMALA